MTNLKLIIKSFIHYLRANLLVALGVAVSTMVLTGSLIIGDSVRYSLEQTSGYRLGEMTHAVAVAERYFRKDIAQEMEAAGNDVKVAPVLLLEGVAVAGGGQQRVNRVQVVGVDSAFQKISNSAIYSSLSENEIIINQNLADKLEVGEGDDIQVRITKASPIPMNAPFVSAEETSVSIRARIKQIAQKEEMGQFNLRTSQTSPYNLFMPIDRLNRLMQFTGRANHLLVSTSQTTDQVYALLDECLKPADAGLKMKYIDATKQVEISTERVFLEPHVADVLRQLPGAQPVLSYFINGISLGAGNAAINKDQEPDEIPYSFASSITDNLKDDEIILTRWAADDLGAKPGDIVRLKYFEVGPLRQLINREAEFWLKEIAPMDNQWADSTRMPWIPGLSDAGHCREWEAGVPINLNAIRDKDEDYWNEWKGAPKAYVSLNKAQELWENRFGSYTAVRFPQDVFSEQNYRESFVAEIDPAILGMTVEPVREMGIEAARNGTDFSGLFIGLSFFILAAAILLTALLFRLNLETRSEEIGVLTALGFKQNQVRKMFLLEGFVIALAGGLTGLILSVLYTSGIFRILNTLWYDIVRTDVLLIKIHPVTLVAGLVISLLVSTGAIYFSLSGFLKMKAADLQKRTADVIRSKKAFLLKYIMWGALVVPPGLLFFQVIGNDMQNPVVFIISGSLLLLGILLFLRKMIIRLNNRDTGKIRLDHLPILNLSRNRGRSLTIITLFALGTFLVISTGSYKLDLFTNADDHSSGTGGFSFFAQSTMPVLYDMNDSEKRAEEGIRNDFSAVQFRQVDGDDASCLNLNRIVRPAILGVNPENLQGRFSFATFMKGVKTDDPWRVLNESFDDGTIPAIADQTVIQWGLGKKVGDVLLYQNETGDTLRLRLVAGTAPSIFQGYVIISDKHFLDNYPSASGSQVFLIDGETESNEQVAEELQMVYRDYGWEMEPAAKRLAEFYSVTNTYLSIFLALGALGMVLGTVGLAVILARTILERRSEIALMQAVGFRISHQFRLISAEYLILLAAGIFAGFIPAVVATFPSFISSNTDASLGTVIIITGIILVNGLFWICLLAWLSLRSRKPVKGLRND